MSEKSGRAVAEALRERLIAEAELERGDDAISYRGHVIGITEHERGWTYHFDGYDSCDDSPLECIYSEIDLRSGMTEEETEDLDERWQDLKDEYDHGCLIEELLDRLQRFADESPSPVTAGGEP